MFIISHRRHNLALLSILLGVSASVITAQTHPQVPSTQTGPVPELESLPGAAAILYLDFDGEIIQSDPYWHNTSAKNATTGITAVNAANPINAAASGFTAEQIRQAYEVVKEDFLPFNVNVTTKRWLYDARDSWSNPMRLRGIVTPTDNWYITWIGRADDGAAPGEAFRKQGTGPFSKSVPFFVFLNDWAGSTMKTAALEIGSQLSHEAGHAFGLSHDSWRYPDNLLYTGSAPNASLGETRFREYFHGDGKGPGGIINGTATRFSTWTPIMGTAAGGLLSQWCPGGVLKGTSNNDCVSGVRSYWGHEIDSRQGRADGVDDSDDIAVLGATGSGTNNFGLRTTEPDGTPDHGGNIGTASSMIVQSSGFFQGFGIIGRLPNGAADEDYFRIQLVAPASVSFLIKPAEPLTHPDPAVERELNSGIANLYMGAQLLNVSGSSIASFTQGSTTSYNPANPTERGSVQATEFLRRRLTLDLGIGTYYVRISPSSLGDPYTIPAGVKSDGAWIYTPSGGFTASGSMGAYSITGNAVWTIPRISSSSVATGVVAQSFTPYQATSTIGSVTWSATGLPPGLSISGAGLISGVPTTQGTYNVILRASTAMTYGEAPLVITIATPAPPVIISAPNLQAEQGQLFTHQIVATGNPTNYGVIGGAIPGLSVNSSGVLSGIPTVAGPNWGMTVTATNAFGTGNQGITMNIRPPLAEALDNALLAITYGGNTPWFHQTATVWNGGDAAQSGAIGHGQSSSFQTTVTGPYGLTFMWRTDCELDWDGLSFDIDGVRQDRLTGNSGWRSASYLIPAGQHTLKWTYTKDESGSTGADAGWVDAIALGSAASQITSSNAAYGTVGQTLGYEITGSYNPTTYGLTGTLPPGLFYLSGIHTVGGNPTRPGSWPVTVSATNAYGTGSMTVTFVIAASFQSWASSNSLTGPDAQPGADPDRDGWVNLIEMACGQNPRVRSTAFQPVQVDPVTRRLRAVFTRNAQYPDLVYQVQAATTTAGPWTTIAESSNGQATTALAGATVSETGTGPITVTVTDTTAPPTVPRRFMRLRIVQQ